MELPFKYIVLYIVKLLHERNMEIIISKNKLVEIIKVIIDKSYFTVREQSEIIENFDYDYELDDFINTYYEYFELKYNNIVFDSFYLDELDDLIVEQRTECDILF